MVSCTDPDDKKGNEGNLPETIVLDPTSVSAGAEGGSFTVSYSFEGTFEGVEVEAVSLNAWVNGFDYGNGVISFNVDANTGAARQTTVTVIVTGGEASATFTVDQAAGGNDTGNYFTLEELEGTVWYATRCQFHETDTRFQELNPESLSEMLSTYITAGEFAENYARDWNAANPDNLMLPEDAMYFGYTDPAEVTDYITVFAVMFYNGRIEVQYGSETPVGGAYVVPITGNYTYDPSTGIMVVQDESNTNYDREVTIQFSRNGEEMVYRVTKTWWPDYQSPIFGDQDRFGFNLSDYNQKKFYLPHGFLEYHLNYMGTYDDVIVDQPAE